MSTHYQPQPMSPTSSPWTETYQAADRDERPPYRDESEYATEEALDYIYNHPYDDDHTSHNGYHH